MEKPVSYTHLDVYKRQAVKDGQEVKVYTKAHAEGYGSVWSESYDYTNYRTGVQIGEDSDVAIGCLLYTSISGKYFARLADRYQTKR